MKCDELKAGSPYCDRNNNMFLYHGDEEQDSELDDEDQVYMKGEVDEAIAELKAENKRLNRELEHVKNGDCINTCDVVEKHVKEELKAKRALWMARGYIMTLLQRDFQRLAYQCNNDDYKKNLLHRRNRYYELSEKCRAKAEEYK